MTDAQRRYMMHFGVGISTYVVMLVLMIVIAHMQPPAMWHAPLALSPMIPAAYVLWAVARGINEGDELARLIQLQALAFAFGGTAFLTFSYGFLEGIGYPKLSMFVVWPLMAVLWVIGLLIAQRRYR